MINYKEIFEQNAITYLDYRKLVDDLLAAGKTTGEDHSEDMLNYTKMNVQRMNRGDKTAKLNPEFLDTIQQLPSGLRFLVISEGWCGDAAQINPVFNKIAESSAGKIELRFVLRDKDTALIDEHLTNGGRAIPVLLVLDSGGNLLLPKWGPRPSTLQTLMNAWKAEGVVMPALGEHLHAWYAKDRYATTQTELAQYLRQLL
jgi:hypothetical protein